MHLVLNSSTGLVSPQYHIEFDDFFSTITKGSLKAKLGTIWQQLAELSHSKVKLIHESPAPIVILVKNEVLSIDSQVDVNTDPVQNDVVTPQSESVLDQLNTTLANEPLNSSEENLGTDYNDDGNQRLARIRLSK